MRLSNRRKTSYYLQVENLDGQKSFPLEQSDADQHI